VSAARLSRFDRACLAHRLHEEVEQTLIGICLANQAHLDRLRRDGSREARDAQRIQELLQRSVRSLDELVRSLDHGRPR